MSRHVGEEWKKIEDLIPIDSGNAQLLCREKVCKQYMGPEEIEELGRTIFTRVRSCEAKTMPWRVVPAWKIAVEKFSQKNNQTKVLKEYRFWVVSGREVIRNRL